MVSLKTKTKHSLFLHVFWCMSSWPTSHSDAQSDPPPPVWKAPGNINCHQIIWRKRHQRVYTWLEQLQPLTCSWSSDLSLSVGVASMAAIARLRISPKCRWLKLKFTRGLYNLNLFVQSCKHCLLEIWQCSINILHFKCLSDCKQTGSGVKAYLTVCPLLQS